MLVKGKVKFCLDPVFFVLLNFALEVLVLQNLNQLNHAAHSLSLVSQVDEVLKLVVKGGLFAAKRNELNVFFRKEGNKYGFYLWLFLQFCPEFIQVFVSVGRVVYFAVPPVVFQSVVSE